MRVQSVGTIGVIAYQRMINKAADRAANASDAGSAAEASKTPAEVLRDKYADCVNISISAEAKRLYSLARIGE